MLTEIISGIWIGDLHDLFKEDFIIDNNINIIINCTEDIGFPNIKHHNIKKVRIPTNDISIIKENIDNIINFINQNIEHNNIFIICYNGFSISPLIVALYIHKVYNINYEYIISSFKSKNKNIYIDNLITNFK